MRVKMVDSPARVVSTSLDSKRPTTNRLSMRTNSSNKCNYCPCCSRLAHKSSAMMMYTTHVLINVPFVSVQLFRNGDIFIGGNQYTYEGNNYQAKSALPYTIEEKINQTIVNQEVGKCPIESTNMLSRGKIYDMKNLKVPDQVRAFNNLYQE